MGGSRWTPEEVEVLRESYGTVSPRLVAQKVNRSLGAVEKKARREGIESERNWTRQETETLESLYGSTPTAEIADRLGRSTKAVYGKASYEGFTGTKRQYDVNHHFFRQADTELSAYWLGALMADGNVRRERPVLRLSVHADDINWVRQFKRDVEATYPVRESRLEGRSPMVTLGIYSQEMKDDLGTQGVVPGKQEGHPNPKVPVNLLHHYVRGLFDGDGCLYIQPSEQPVVTITGTLSQARWLHERIPAQRWGYRGDGGVYEQSDGTVKWQIGGRLKVLGFRDWLYNEATRWMDRKRKKFYEIEEG